jgi:hypothetical protein
VKVVENLEGFGHENIRATNRTTFEFTKESHLTTRGDCIVAVNTSKGPRDLSLEFRSLAKNPAAEIKMRMKVGSLELIVVGAGNPGLEFTHSTDLVGRKSSFVCGRTLMVGSDRAACDFPRELVRALRNPSQRAEITLTAETVC